MKKYRIELSEEQLRLVANCLEDISRFASGQTELKNTIEEMTKHLDHDISHERLKDADLYLRGAKAVLLPELQTNQSYGYNSTEFIGNTYQIYRTILHCLAIENNWDNVYSSPALKSGTMGVVKIEKV